MFTACVSDTAACDSARLAPGSVDVEHRDWAYLVPTSGVSYRGEPADVSNVADPRLALRNANSSFTLSFNFRLPRDIAAAPIVKLRRLEGQLTDTVQWTDLCWGIHLDGLYNKVRVLASQIHPTIEVGFYDSSQDYSDLLQFDCPASGLDDDTWQHVALVSTPDRLRIYLRGALLCEHAIDSTRHALVDCEEGILRLGGMITFSERLYTIGALWGAKKFRRGACALPPCRDRVRVPAQWTCNMCVCSLRAANSSKCVGRAPRVTLPR
jgi:hypothetical protein